MCSDRTHLQIIWNDLNRPEPGHQPRHERGAHKPVEIGVAAPDHGGKLSSGAAQHQSRFRSHHGKRNRGKVMSICGVDKHHLK